MVPPGGGMQEEPVSAVEAGEACFVISQQFPKARGIEIPVAPGRAFLSSEQSQLGTRLEDFQSGARVTRRARRVTARNALASSAASGGPIEGVVTKTPDCKSNRFSVPTAVRSLMRIPNGSSAILPLCAAMLRGSK